MNDSLTIISNDCDLNDFMSTVNEWCNPSDDS